METHEQEMTNRRICGVLPYRGDDLGREDYEHLLGLVRRGNEAKRRDNATFRDWRDRIAGGRIVHVTRLFVACFLHKWKHWRVCVCIRIGPEFHRGSGYFGSDICWRAEGEGWAVGGS